MADKVLLLFDTDMGPDCDDAGALAILHKLCDFGECALLAACCTVIDVYGAHTIDAIGRYYGRSDTPIGTLYGPGFGGEAHQRYNRIVSSKFPHRFKEQMVPDAVSVYRKALAEAEDSSITFVAVGMWTNLYNLLTSFPDRVSELNGQQLFNQKVAKLVCMAGDFTDSQNPEFNVVSDVRAFSRGLALIQVPVDFLPYETGLPVITGRSLVEHEGPENPVAECYRRLCGGAGRPSWDLLTAYYAVRGGAGTLVAGEPGVVKADRSGHTRFTPKANGKHRLLSLCEPAETAAQLLDDFLSLPPMQRFSDDG